MFKDDFYSFMAERLGGITGTDEYHKINSEIENELESKLGSDEMIVISDKIGELEMSREEAGYLRGFKDSLNLINCLNEKKSFIEDIDNNC